MIKKEKTRYSKSLDTKGQCEMPGEGLRKLGHALNQENMEIEIFKQTEIQLNFTEANRNSTQYELPESVPHSKTTSLRSTDKRKKQGTG